MPEKSEVKSDVSGKTGNAEAPEQIPNVERKLKGKRKQKKKKK